MLFLLQNDYPSLFIRNQFILILTYLLFVSHFFFPEIIYKYIQNRRLTVAAEKLVKIDTPILQNRIFLCRSALPSYRFLINIKEFAT